MLYDDLKITGYSDPNGIRFVSASYKGKTAIIPHALCHGKGENILPACAERGLVLPGPSAAKELLERINRVYEFEPANVVSATGYTDGHFTLGNGSVIGQEASRSMVAFSTDPLLFAEAGTLTSWKTQVARHIVGQDIPMMAMLFAFAEPLAAATGNAICRSIEFVGAPSSGIEVLPKLLASVSGAPVRQVARFEQVVNGREGVSAYHNDLALPVVGSDVALAGETAGRRALAVKKYLFPSYTSTDDTTRGSCLVSFSHEPLLNLAEGTTELASLAAGKHISIRVTGDRKYGIFDVLPYYTKDAAALTRGLSSRVSKHHGVALRPFLEYLVNAHSRDPRFLHRLISKRMAAFRKAAEGNRNNHCDAIITDTFAMAYAAGWIARKQGILPVSWRIGHATMQCYRRYMYQAVPPRSFNDILLEIAAEDGVVEIGGSDTQAASPNTTNVFVKHGGRGTEIMIRPAAINALIPDWDRWVGTPSVKRVMVMEKGHLTVKRRLSDGAVHRVYCFRLSPPGKRATLGEAVTALVAQQVAAQPGSKTSRVKRKREKAPKGRAKRPDRKIIGPRRE